MLFDLPTTGERTYAGEITTLMRQNTKPRVTDILEKNAPAYISVADYRTKVPGTVSYVSNKFFLQGITEGRQEKVQVMETFGDPSIMFFDERTKQYTIRGTLLDANKGNDQIAYNWATAFRIFYEEHLRGTNLAKNKQIALLTVNDQIYMGYPTTLAMNTDAGAPMVGAFTMTWLVTKHLYLPPVTVMAAGTSPQYFQNLRKLYTAGGVLSEAKGIELNDLLEKLKLAEDEATTLSESKSLLEQTLPEPEWDDPISFEGADVSVVDAYKDTVEALKAQNELIAQYTAQIAALQQSITQLENE